MTSRTIWTVGVIAMTGFLSVSCARPSPSLSSVQSAFNNIFCDVDYLRLEVGNLAGIKIVDDGIAAAEKIRHLNELNALPTGFLNAYLQNDLPVKLAKTAITEFPEMAVMAGTVPRGWEGTGYNWDDVPGTFYGGALLLGPSTKVNNAWSLATHEGTHGYDRTLGITTGDQGLIALYESTAANPADVNGSYRMSNVEEFLAVGVDELNCNATTKANVQAWYPEFAQYITKHYKGIFVH